MKRIIILFNATLFSTVLFVSNSYAVTDQERAVLQRFHNELTLTKQLLKEAERAVNQHDKRKVNYIKIFHDLEVLLNGINDLIESKRRTPRTLPKLEGDYR